MPNTLQGIGELNAAALDWGRIALDNACRDWRRAVSDSGIHRVIEWVNHCRGSGQGGRSGKRLRGRERQQQQQQKKKRLINKFASLKVTKLLSWWYVLRLKGLSCRSGPAGQAVRADSLASLPLHSPSGTPLPVGSVCRVLKQATADSLAFYTQHSSLLSFCALLPFHMLISSSSMRVRKRKGAGGWATTKTGSAYIGINKDVVPGQTRDGHLRWFLFRSNKFLCGNHFIIRLSVRHEATTATGHKMRTRHPAPCASSCSSHAHTIHTVLLPSPQSQSTYCHWYEPKFLLKVPPAGDGMGAATETVRDWGNRKQNWDLH